MSSGFLMVNFAPIAVLTAEVYEVNDMWVNACVMIFLVAFVILNFPSINIIERFGLKITVSFRQVDD